MVGGERQVAVESPDRRRSGLARQPVQVALGVRVALRGAARRVRGGPRPRPTTTLAVAADSDRTSLPNSSRGRSSHGSNPRRAATAESPERTAAAGDAAPRPTEASAAARRQPTRGHPRPPPRGRAAGSDPPRRHPARFRWPADQAAKSPNASSTISPRREQSLMASITQRGRLHGRVHFEFGVAAGAEGVHACIVPDVGSITTVLAELDMLRCGAVPAL